MLVLGQIIVLLFAIFALTISFIVILTYFISDIWRNELKKIKKLIVSTW